MKLFGALYKGNLGSNLFESFKCHYSVAVLEFVKCCFCATIRKAIFFKCRIKCGLPATPTVR